MFAIYPWQKDEWQRLLTMQKTGRFPHALLLCGADGIGLRQFAQAFAMQRFCTAATNSDGNACGQCTHCHLFLGGNHPDVMMVEAAEAGKQIKIADVRGVIDYVALKSFSGSQKIIIIEPADAMNRATANALLKTLEEPPPQSILILLTHQPARLPVTIRSRCQRIDFKPATNETATDWLTEQTDTSLSVPLLLHLSNGAPLKALALLEHDQLQQRQVILADLLRLKQAKHNIVQIAANWQNFGCEQVLICLMHLLQDIIRLKLLGEQANILNFDMKENLQDIVKAVDLAILIQCYQFIQNKYQETMSPMNLNPLNILEAVLIQWCYPDTISLRG